jgi:RNA recognition motif-containing protein
MKIYVGNLPWSIDDDKLAELFEPYGDVATANVVTDRDTGRSRGFGFVEMRDDEQARGAIAGLADHQAEGRTLNVNEAKPRENRGGGGGGGGGGRW